MCSLDARSGNRPCRSLYLKMVKGEEKGDALVTPRARKPRTLGKCSADARSDGVSQCVPLFVEGDAVRAFVLAQRAREDGARWTRAMTGPSRASFCVWLWKRRKGCNGATNYALLLCRKRYPETLNSGSSQKLLGLDIQRPWVDILMRRPHTPAYHGVVHGFAFRLAITRCLVSPTKPG
jgi:hypothetical protein